MREDRENSAVYEMITDALFDNYESIYDINLDTHEYRTYFQSDNYRKLELSRQGEDFFAALPAGVKRTIAPEDRQYLERMLEREALVRGVETHKYYTVVYRIQSGEEKVYHQLRAIRRVMDGEVHVLMGIRNIDDLFRMEAAHRAKIAVMEEKEKSHLEAVLASAAAYMEANLTKNLAIETKAGRQDGRGQQRRIAHVPSVEEIPSYDELQAWIGDHLVTQNRDRYLKVSSRGFLMDLFRKGYMRTSATFSVRNREGGDLPCHTVYYLYEGSPGGDIFLFCVIYDLTDQQRQEREMERMEDELRMSRIRNSTSQMQPHFLYNALGSIQEVMLMDPEYASELLGDFTVHLRSCVRAMSSDDPIPFEEEVRNIQAYTNIEKMRLGDKLDMRFEIGPAGFRILPLCIQPIVENAIRHGVHKRGKAGGRVILRTSEEEDAWIIQVEDTGVGFDVGQYRREMREGKRDSTGLENLSFRLRKVMGAVVDVQSTPGTGTTVTVRLPKEPD